MNAHNQNILIELPDEIWIRICSLLSIREWALLCRCSEQFYNYILHYITHNTDDEIIHFQEKRFYNDVMFRALHLMLINNQ